jgi:exodeoxyribonuclease VII small subunit
VTDLSLEERLARLEAIARGLESDDIELDGALEMFEEAVAHLRETEALLEGAQLRVDELLGTLERAELRPLGDTGAESDT